MTLRGGLCLVVLLLALPLPAAAQKLPPELAFPSLPPSKHCTKDDIAGLWQLVNVYEVPAGRELADYKAFPYQYLFFNSNDTYNKTNVQRPESPADIAREMSQQSSPVLQQYVVDKSGFVFFYQNRVATDTQACFIVTSRTSKFRPGQMLLMPPEGQHVGRLVKVYDKQNTSEPKKEKPHTWQPRKWSKWEKWREKQ